MSMMKDAVAKATFWVVLETGGAQASVFLLFVVFARILSPEAFGVYALAMAILGAVNMVLFQGFGDALIQIEHLDEARISTAFWTNMMLSVGMILVLQIIALLAPVLFGEPLLRPVIASVAFLCIPRALISVHNALFRRTLDLRVFAIRTIVGYMVGGVVGVTLALFGLGVWALVISQFVQSALIVLIMWRSSDWRPKLLFSGPAFRELLRFSKHFMTASVISSSIDDFGSVLIGLGLDITAVGYYALALKVMRAAIAVIMTPLALVMLPTLSRIAHNRPQFGAAYSSMVLTTSMIWLPVIAGLGLVAPDLLPKVFGTHWTPAVPVIQAMCFASLSMPLWTFSGQALSALGRPDAFARIAYWQLGLYCVVFPLASHFGIVAVGWAWSALSAVMVPIALMILHRLSGLDIAALLMRNAKIVLCGGALVASFLLFKAGLPVAPWSIAVASTAGAVVYAAVLNTLLPGHLTRIIMLARGAMPARGS